MEAFVRLADQPSVEPSLGDPRLVRGDQQDGLALGIEGRGDPCRGGAGHEVRGRRAAVTRDRPAARRERWRDS